MTTPPSQRPPQAPPPQAPAGGTPLAHPGILDQRAAVARREQLRAAGRRLVLTNGCFDLLHAGHLHFLHTAARLAGETGELWVALNTDASVRALKGPQRPIVPEAQRAYALASLAVVSGVVLFDEPGAERIQQALAPDVYVKAGDYTLETLNPAERAVLEAVGAEIRFLPFLEGFSTTQLIERIRQQEGPS